MGCSTKKCYFTLYMGSDKNKETIESIFAVLIGVFALLALQSLFENDESKIISKKGRKLLSDDKEMRRIDEQIQKSQSNNEHQEVFI